VTERNRMLAQIAEVYHRYGFDPLETSAVETVEALGKFLPDVDRPNAGVFAFQEETTALAGAALRHDRAARPRRGAVPQRPALALSPLHDGPRLAQREAGAGAVPAVLSMRCGYGGVGVVAADAEICAMLADTLEAVGIPRGDYIVRVNNRKVLNGVLEVDGPVGDDEGARARGIVLRTIDKFDKVGEAGVRELLGEGRRLRCLGRLYRRGAGLTRAQAEPVIAFLDRRKAVSACRDALPNLRAAVGDLAIGSKGVAELEQIADLLAAQGYGPDRIVIDPSVVRGLGYYTGPVYEAELTFEITDEKGRPRQFGSVAGGGRYDDLVKRFTGQEVPATGISIGVDRLLAALRAKGRIGGTRRARRRHRDGPRPDGRLPGDGLRAARRRHPGGGLSRQPQELRQPAEIRRQAAKPRGRDPGLRRGRANGKVQLKDLILGAKLAQDATLEEWKSQPAQTEVDRADLVAGVKALLDRHR
jgi:histidyl-tRNA synthetase